jgi:hypothetical protein
MAAKLQFFSSISSGKSEKLWEYEKNHPNRLTVRMIFVPLQVQKNFKHLILN